MWLVGMGVATGCGCKEVYRFPHTTYPYSSCICSFLQQHPYFFVHFLINAIINDPIKISSMVHVIWLVITRGAYSFHENLFSVFVPSLIHLREPYQITILWREGEGDGGADMRGAGRGRG